MHRWLTNSVANWRMWQLETRVLVIVTLGSIASGLAVVLAAFTSGWSTLVMTTNNGHNVSGSQGLWKIQYKLDEVGRTYHYVLPHLFEDNFERDVDDTVATLLRATIAFVGISLLMSILSNLFALYSLNNRRYTFKRATAALLAMTAVCNIVCIDVYNRVLRVEKSDGKLVKLPRVSAVKGIEDLSMFTTIDPTRLYAELKVTDYSYGYSFALVITSAVVNGIGAVTFFIYSRKLKGTRAPDTQTAAANEEFLIGRVS